MRRLRRCTALIVALLTLQLIVLESGVACAMPSMGSGAAAMTRMDMGEGHASSPAPHAPSSDHQPCGFPWAPGNGNGLAPCAPAALVSPPVSVTVPPAPAAAIAALVVLAPPMHVRPPELPPPRA